MRALLVVLIVAAGLHPQRAEAQWRATLEYGGTHFWGGSGGTGDAEGVSFGPYRPTTFTARLGRQMGRAGVELGLQYSRVDYAVRGGEFTTVAENLGRLLSLQPALTYRLARLPLDGGLDVVGGPILERWSLDGQGTQLRVGGQAGFSATFAISPRWGANIRLTEAAISSPLGSADLPDRFERRTAWRRSIGIGLFHQL